MFDDAWKGMKRRTRRPFVRIPFTVINANHKLFRDMKASLISYNLFKVYSKLLRSYFQFLKEDYFKYKFIKQKGDIKVISKTLINVLGRNPNQLSIDYLKLIINTHIINLQMFALEFTNYLNFIPLETQENLRNLFNY